MDQHWQNRENGEITSHDYETDDRIPAREREINDDNAVLEPELEFLLEVLGAPAGLFYGLEKNR